MYLQLARLVVRNGGCCSLKILESARLHTSALSKACCCCLQKLLICQDKNSNIEKQQHCQWPTESKRENKQEISLIRLMLTISVETHKSNRVEVFHLLRSGTHVLENLEPTVFLWGPFFNSLPLPFWLSEKQLKWN